MMCATPAPCVPTPKDPMFAPVKLDIQGMERHVQVRMVFYVSQCLVSYL